MEGLSIGIFYITLIGIILSVILIIYSLIKKDFKYRPKKLSIILVVFLIAFVGSTTFYGAVQSPESKAKYEANKKVKEDEKLKKEIEENKINEEKISKESEKQDKNEEKVETELKTKENSDVEIPVESPKVDDRFTVNAETNTTEAVNELYYKAKENAKEATVDDLKEAIKFINDNYNNYWTDNEVMHKTMYYGSLLQCANIDKAKADKKTINYTMYELGTDAVQVVKYGYRDSKEIDNQATKSNLKQIKKSLDKIPDEYKK